MPLIKVLHAGNVVLLPLKHLAAGGRRSRLRTLPQELLVVAATIVHLPLPCPINQGVPSLRELVLFVAFADARFEGLVR